MQAAVGRVGLRYQGKSINTGGTSSSVLLGDEPNGMAIDFLENNYFVIFSTPVEALLWDEESGMAMDLTNNTYAVRV